MATRQDVAEFMDENPNATATIVAAELDISLAAASKHLQNLRASGRIPRPVRGGKIEAVVPFKSRTDGPPASSVADALISALDRKLELRLELAELDRAIEAFRASLGGEK